MLISKQTIVGIADMKIVRAPSTLITYALGSCIGVCIYDPVICLGGMVHIMLPETLAGQASGNIFKFADTGILEMIRKMEVFGGVRSRMTAKIAGGAKMFDIPGDSKFGIGNIGKRNIDSVRKVLQKDKIRLVKEDVGFNYARTMIFDTNTGQVTIRSYGRQDNLF